MNDQRPSLKQTIHGLVKPDWLFGFMLIISVIFFVTTRTDLQIGGGLTVSPLLKAAIVFGILIIVSFATTFGISLDRKFADDYYFQMMSHGAVVAIVSSLLMAGTFVLFKNWLPPLSIKDLFSVMMAGWALGYFFYRWRGFNA